MILDLYLARKFLWSFLGVTGVFVLLTGLIELIDKLGDFPDLAFWDVLGIVLLNLPAANYEILPLLMILSSVALFLRLARSSELVVLRAAGRSAIRALVAPGLVALLIGVLGLVMINPIVAATAKREHDLANRYRGADASTLAVSRDGLWLRQGGADGQTVIHAAAASSDLGTLHDASFLAFAPDGTPVRRIAAREARLGDGAWVLHDTKIWSLDSDANPEATARRAARIEIPTELTRSRILDSFGKPEFISIWDLPGFIGQLEAAGFSARRYAMWFHMELAKPLFLISLVLIAAAFTMRPARLSNTGLSVMASVVLGFGLYYIRNLAQILGENGQIPILLAAWATPVAAVFLSLGILLHMEDG